jgi:hypothetical protein
LLGSKVAYIAKPAKRAAICSQDDNKRKLKKMKNVVDK